MAQEVRFVEMEAWIIEIDGRIRTVEITAAGTLAMTDITAFKLRSMNTVAVMFAKKLRGRSHHQYRYDTELRWNGDSRDEEVDQTITEDHLHEPAASTLRECELPCCEGENHKVEGHGIDERSGEESAIGRGDNTACAFDPGSLEQNTVEK